MARALDTLARLRRLEADEARRALGEAAAAEAGARQHLAHQHQARQREAALAAGAADPLNMAYGAWLPASAAAIAQAEAACARCEAASQAAIAALTARRAALEAAETLIGVRDAAERRRLARRAQLRLDELGHRL